VIVPPNPGVTSALGCLLVDVQHDFSETYLAAAGDADPAAIEAAFARLEGEALERLVHEGVTAADTVLQRSIDMMYQGQWRSLAVAAPSPVVAMAGLVEAFHRQHEREYNFRRDDAPVSLFRLNLKAIGVVPKAELAVARSDRHHPCPGRHAPGLVRGRRRRRDAGLRALRPAGRPQPRRARRGRAGRLHRADPAGHDRRGRQISQHHHPREGLIPMADSW